MTKEPKSWRAFHAAETVAQQVRVSCLRPLAVPGLMRLTSQERMEAVLQKMRGAYKSHTDDRKTSKQVDGVMMAKRRKLNSMVNGASRPKTLMEKARVNSRRIGTIYAPKRRRGFHVPEPSPPPPPPALPASTMISSRAPGSKKPPPKIQTITRTVKVTAPSPRPRPAPSATSGKMSPPLAMSPPPTTNHRPVAPLPSRRLSAASPPPPRPTQPNRNDALSPPPLSPPPSKAAPAGGYQAVRPSAKALNSIFLKRKR